MCLSQPQNIDEFVKAKMGFLSIKNKKASTPYEERKERLALKLLIFLLRWPRITLEAPQ